MDVFTKIRSIEKKFPWSFFGFLLGILSFLFAAILFFWNQSEDNFDFSILIDSEENLVEIREQIKNLQILYNGKDIIVTNEELKLLTFTIRNDGKDILKSYYDPDLPFGIVFNNSKLLSFKIFESNSKYLKDEIKPRILTKDSSETIKESKYINLPLDSTYLSLLLFNQVIFERDTYVKIKTYLIQPKGSLKTDIRFIGKIAGIKTNLIVEYASAGIVETDKYKYKYTWIFVTFGIILTVLASIAYMNRYFLDNKRTVLDFKNEFSLLKDNLFILNGLPVDGLLKGNEEIQNGNYKLAEIYLKQELFKNPSNINAWVSLAITYRYLCRYNDAINSIDQALKLDVKKNTFNAKGQISMVQAEILVAYKSYEKAIEIIEKDVLTKNPGFHKAQNLLKKCKSKLKESTSD